MDALPVEYVQHNVPLVCFSGLPQDSSPADGTSDAAKSESGTKITFASPECSESRANVLRSELSRYEQVDPIWNGPSTSDSPLNGKIRVKTVGRTFRFPPRKAAPLAISAGVDEHGSTVPMSPSISSLALHSPLSPLSPGSPIYPDGLMTPLWFRKHQEQVPAVIVACFDITSGTAAALVDQIQSDVNMVRSSVSRSGFKTRLAVLMLGDEAAIDASEIEARIVAVRRAASLDAKTLFFMPSGLSPADRTIFVQNMLLALHSTCIDYYRDLTKHARRKKMRVGAVGGISNPGGTGGSLSLSTSGWNVRYEIKQGVFAEFRGEMDVAERCFSGAIEELFRDDGLLESTPSWAPRWNDARLACDTLAIRVIRCQLWTNSTSGAVQSWANYQARMKDLVDRRGKGSETYSWATWEARWACIMAELVRKAQPTAFPYVVPSSATDRLPPFHHLHRSGYWWRLALQKTRIRRKRAEQIPEEDRIPPSKVPASVAASRNRNYDLYLALQPHEELHLPNEDGYDYFEDLGRISREAIADLQHCGQDRAANQVQLELGKDVMAVERYSEAMEYLKPLWQTSSWRHDDWTGPLDEILSLVSKCARATNDAQMILATTWESLAISDSSAANVADVSACLGGIPSNVETVRLQAEASELRGPLQPSFAFEDSTGRVGEPLLCQLMISSVAPSSSVPIVLKQIRITLSTDRSVLIHHQINATDLMNEITLANLTGTNGSTGNVLHFNADLTIPAQKTRVFGFDLDCREAGLLAVESIALLLETSDLSLEHTYRVPHIALTPFFFFHNGSRLQRKALACGESILATILPKPPKLQIMPHNVCKQYYTDENVQFTIEFISEESDPIDATAKVLLVDEAGNNLAIGWGATDTQEAELAFSIAAGVSHRAELFWTGPAEPGNLTLNIEVDYVLTSDRETPLSKSRTLEMQFGVPMEARFEFGPQYHEGPWPSFFDLPKDDQIGIAEGITHQWRVVCRLQAIGIDALDIHDMTMTLHETPADALCTILPMGSPKENVPLPPGSIAKQNFLFTTQKKSLDDRRPSGLDFAVEIHWSRQGQSSTSVTTLLVPRLTLPCSEPRVLLTMSDAESSEVDVMLRYHLENPSLHFLTFALTMEASDEFAFAGSKYRQLSLAPLSRICVDYGLLIHDEAQRTIRPVLQVLDSYYQKNLRTHPGGPGVSSDEHGILVNLAMKA